MKDQIHRRTWAINIQDRRIDVSIVSTDDFKNAMKNAYPNSFKDDDEIPDGLYDGRRYKIFLNEGLYGTPGLMDTLGHEIVHAMTHDLDQLGAYNEEVIADIVGRQLWKVARQLQTVPKGWVV